jgi:hypothetical protein
VSRRPSPDRGGDRPEKGFACGLGGRPRPVETRRGEAHPPDAGVRRRLPQQGHAVAVPAHGVRHAPVRARGVVDLPPLAVPTVGHQRRQRQSPVDLAHQQVTHERQELGRGPPVVAVAHAPAVEPGMDGLGPGPGRRGGVDHPRQPVEAPPVARPELDRGELQRQVRSEPRVADALVEGATVREREALADDVDGGYHAGVVWRQQVEWRAGDERPDGAGIDAPPGAGGDGRCAQPFGRQRQRRLDVAPHRLGEPLGIGGGVGLVDRPQQLRAGAQPGHAPEVVPVEVVERPQVLGRHARGQQAGHAAVGPPGRRAGAALAVDPVDSPGDRADHRVDQPGVAGQAPVPCQRDQRRSVGVPFVALAEEEAVAALAPRVRGKHLGHLVVVAVAVECAQQVGGVAEPEPVVGGGARRDLVAVVEQQQVAPVGGDCLGQPVVGQRDPHAPLALRLPAPRHRRGGRQHVGERRRVGQAAARHPAPPGAWLGIERYHGPERRRVRQREDERRLRQPRGVADRSRPGVARAARHDREGRVARVERRRRDPCGRPRQQQRHAPVHGDGRAVDVDALDDRQPLGVVGPHRQRQRDRQLRAVLDLDDHQLTAPLDRAAPDGVHALDGVARRHAHRSLDHRGGADQPLAHGHVARGQVPTVVGTDPPVERPPVEPRCDQAPGVDDRLPGRVEVADRRPVAMGDVGEEGQVTPRHESTRGRVELALEPERPDPVGPDLGGGPRAQRPEDRAGTDGHELARQLDLDRLAEALEGRQVADHVVGDPQPAHQTAQQPGACRHRQPMP